MADKKKYRCTACRWKFTRNYAPMLCPYCGKACVEPDTGTGAGDILREIEDMERQTTPKR